mmetsp:Transcript_18753/g.28093  ORF Transcript_18753/g.28093 Transcript_18753/m.28093 type:complete len:326 (+) Transcript_18753:94-1071(+)
MTNSLKNKPFALLLSIAVNAGLVCVLVTMMSSVGSSNISLSQPGLQVRGGGNIALRGPARISRNTRVNAERKFFVGGNWKCNGNMASVKELVSSLNDGEPTRGNVEVVCAPPSPYIDYVRQNLRSDFQISGQNCWIKGTGAYTGEICPEMLKDIGCEWVILGHSERRHLTEIKETDEIIADKTKYALDSGLGVIFCIGELLEEREAGQTLQVCERQMAALASKIDNWDKVVIAYEPVWAIGTGVVATPEQAQEVHDSVRSWLRNKVSPQVADSVRILYGGSVNPQNCDELATKPDIDGFLVGGASLTPGFLQIVDSYKHSMPVSQ